MASIHTQNFMTGPFIKPGSGSGSPLSGSLPDLKSLTAKNEAKRKFAERNEASCIFFFSLRSETKNSKRNEAKTNEKIGPVFSLEQAKTKRNGSHFASFLFEAKKNFKRNRRTLTGA
jgi:hypothetical protein